MDTFSHPKLKNSRTGAIVEVNTSPFSIGRGLSCNYVIPNKTISRIHCVLEFCDNAWFLKDTSTNGTFLNRKLIKQTSSAPLKDNDIISLELDESDSFVFNMDNNIGSSELTDEQLCNIADSLLNQVQFLNANPVMIRDVNHLNAASYSEMGSPIDIIPPNPLHDHMYVAKDSHHESKRPRIGRSPRAILGSGSSRNFDVVSLLQHNYDKSAGHAGTSHRDEVVAQSVCDCLSFFGHSMHFDDRAGTERDAVRPLRDGHSNRAVCPIVNETDASTSQIDSCSQTTVEGGQNEAPVEAEGSNAASSTSQEVTCTAEPGPSKERTDKPEEETAAPETAESSKEAQPDNYQVMENELQCVICSELFIKAVTLNCSHSFCKYCINMWKKNKSDCPICRTKVTSMINTIVLDNLIEKVVEGSSEEIKQHRSTILQEREKQEEEARPLPSRNRPSIFSRGVGRAGVRRSRRGRNTRTQTTESNSMPRINILDPMAINIGALMSSVIEVSSESEWSSDTESMSADELRDEYDQDDWYTRSTSRWGAYGFCFRCGSPTHWANTCPRGSSRTNPTT